MQYEYNGIKVHATNSTRRCNRREFFRKRKGNSHQKTKHEQRTLHTQTAHILTNEYYRWRCAHRFRTDKSAHEYGFVCILITKHLLSLRGVWRNDKWQHPYAHTIHLTALAKRQSMHFCIHYLFISAFILHTRFGTMPPLVCSSLAVSLPAEN